MFFGNSHPIEITFATGSKPTPSILSLVLIKKCMQGQVYLKDQNNCRGKGSEADGWGAEKYQYCPTNDYSCERRTTLLNYADEIKSPAAVSCDQNIDLGRKWKLPEQSNFRGDSSSFFNIIQEIPKVITNTVIVPILFQLELMKCWICGWEIPRKIYIIFLKQLV